MMGKTTYDMPLHYQSAAGTRGGTSLDHQAHRSAVPNRAVQLLDSNMTAAASVLEPQSIRESPAASGTETAAAGTGSDPEELVEKIWQKIMRRLTIEKERRGCTPWV
jgi:hypothetical protein